MPTYYTNFINLRWVVLEPNSDVPATEVKYQTVKNIDQTWTTDKPKVIVCTGVIDTRQIVVNRNTKLITRLKSLE